MKEISSLIGNELYEVERALMNTLSSPVPIINRVGSYIIGSGGKRLRPILYLLVAKGFNYDGRHNIPLACVFEYIHTATLLHDDVLDHAEMRRGNSSANTLWGDQVSVLVGDFLLSKAFSILVETGNMKAMQVISQATTDVTEGETMQTVRGSDMNLTEEEYITIISNKTASLIAAACQTGAIMGNAPPDVELSFRNYGRNLGIAFQMVDDSLDYVSDSKKFGKALCKDLQGGKITLPLIYTLGSSSREDRQIITGCLNQSAISMEHADTILQLIKKYAGLEYVLGRAREYVRRALDNVNGFDNTPVRDALIATAHYVVDRER